MNAGDVEVVCSRHAMRNRKTITAKVIFRMAGLYLKQKAPEGLELQGLLKFKRRTLLLNRRPLDFGRTVVAIHVREIDVSMRWL